MWKKESSRSRESRDERRYLFHWKIFLEQEWRKGMRGLCERIHVHVTTVTYLSKHILVV